MDYFMVTFFLIRHIRITLNTKVQLPEWDKKLNIMGYVAIGLTALQYSVNEDWAMWFWQPFMFYLLWLVYTYDEFSIIRSLAQVVILFAVVGFLNTFFLTIFFKSIYKPNSSYFEMAESFSIILCFGVWFYGRKQQKVLVKEREDRQKEEEISKAKRESLEYLVAERTYELTQQKEELQSTIEVLKSTQNQLIQSEKMASLGELTAGIAHEIQNPLNFVNNFSELSVELCQELEEELDKVELDAADKDYIKGIIADLSQNQQKITHHGKRADSIVKGMLQHSRASTGEKEPIDINALADEYMRLAYHGLRAKNKEFNAKLTMDFDENIGLVKVMPQDLGRVFLNLFTNAFYAVAEKKRKILEENTGIVYEPEVKVVTRKFDNKLYVRVEDNGTGMPESVIVKIFQPFFTTKPTGQGTGLGLSMSYDIITNMHSGLLEVESEPGEKTVFKITIPIVS